MGAPLGNQNAVGNRGGTGRPSEYDPNYHPEQAKNLCMLFRDVTDEKLASVFGVSEATITNWKQKHVEFCSALKEGKEIADGNVVRSLYERAMGYSHPAVKIMNTPDGIKQVEYIEHYPPDATSMIFWLKNRQPQVWRDKQVLEVEPEKVLADVLGVSEEELPE